MLATGGMAYWSFLLRKPEDDWSPGLTPAVKSGIVAAS
jgi:hypothetical protein